MFSAVVEKVSMISELVWKRVPGGASRIWHRWNNKMYEVTRWRQKNYKHEKENLHRFKMLSKDDVNTLQWRKHLMCWRWMQKFDFRCFTVCCISYYHEMVLHNYTSVNDRIVTTTSNELSKPTERPAKCTSVRR